jgi:hypothetical protein
MRYGSVIETDSHSPKSTLVSPQTESYSPREWAIAIMLIAMPRKSSDLLPEPPD